MSGLFRTIAAGIGLYLLLSVVAGCSQSTNSAPANSNPASPNLANVIEQGTLPTQSNADATPEKDTIAVADQPSVKQDPPVTQLANVKTKPVAKEVVFPTKREFQHDWVIQDVEDKDLVYRTLGTKSVEGALVIIRLLIYKKPSTLLSRVGFQISSETERLYGKSFDITLRTENNTMVLEGNKTYENDREGTETLDTIFDLDQFVALLSATTVKGTIGEFNFTLDESSIEAMRDLASRAPDGKTSDGTYLVKHATDNRSPAPKQTNEKGDSEFKKILEVLRKNRKPEMDQLVGKVNDAKSRLKTHLIADDQSSVTKVKREINEHQSRLLKAIEAPISAVKLDPWTMTVGQIGTLGGRFNVIQILSKERGEILVHLSYGPRAVTLMVIDKNAKNLASGADYLTPKVFAVIGTYSYESRGGESKNVLKLQECDDSDIFGPAELSEIRNATETEYEFDFTDAEKALMKSAVDTNKGDAKTRRGRSFVEAGKVLLKKGNNAGAKKQFEKAIAEDPESDSGKEAAKLLESLP